jgi:hemolysin III
MSQHTVSEKDEDHFSPSFFVIVIASSLALTYFAVAIFATDVFVREMKSGWLLLTVSFLTVHLGNSFFEFFFHRYVLHAPVVPFLAYFYKQHTRHHALTRVMPPKPNAGVVNKYPILEESQHEASFFPAYSFIVFALVATPIFVAVKFIWPAFPIFIPGYAALAWSLSLYELLHALEHKPIKSWAPLLESPGIEGSFWRTLYAFHLRHHADIHSNEGISGFFGIPIPDFVFGTWVNPKTLYEHHSYVDAREFASPTPRFIGWIDRWAEHAVKKRRHQPTPVK